MVERATFAKAATAAAIISYENVIGPWPHGMFELGPHEDLEITPALGDYPIGSRETYDGLQIIDGHWVGVHHSSRQGPCDAFVMTDCDVSSHHKWASRSYGMRALNRIERCSFRDVYMEHGLYWNMHGYSQITGDDTIGGIFARAIPLDTVSLVIKRTLFENIASQALQFVQQGRGAEYSDPVAGLSHGGPIKIRGCLFRNIGYNRSGNARASFAMSFFRSHNDVDVAGVFLDNSGQATSRGAFLCEARGKLALSNSIFLTGVLTQPMAKIKETYEVRITGCEFHARGGQAWISIDNCPNVVVEGCSGNVDLKVNGQSMGPISRGFLT